jgi:hypothetical protein
MQSQSKLKRGNMKFSGKVSLLAALAIMSVGSQAFALDVGLTTTGAIVGGPVGAGLALAGTAIDVTYSAAHAKEAVLNAAPDAARVLQGGEATDAFNAGKAGAEALLNVQFASDSDAAVAILELTEASAQ